MMISWWLKHVGVILSVLMCDIRINVLLQTSALHVVGPLHILVLSIYSGLHVSALWAIIRPFVNFDTEKKYILHKTSPFTLKIHYKWRCYTFITYFMKPEMWCVGAFAWSPKANISFDMSARLSVSLPVCLSVCISAVPTRRIAVKFMLGTSMEIYRNSNLVKIGQKYQALYMKS
jgi:hypothetical protein